MSIISTDTLNEFDALTYPSYCGASTPVLACVNPDNTTNNGAHSVSNTKLVEVIIKNT